MSNPVFAAKFSVRTSSLVMGYTDRWLVTARVDDFEGYWSGSDVAAGNAVFLDTQGDAPVGGSVSRYKVLQFISANGSSVEVVLQYDDSGIPVDPAVASYMDGMVCAQSANGFCWLSSDDVNSLTRRLVTYARNQNMYIGVDTKISTKADKTDLEVVTHTIVPAEAITKSFTLPSTPADPTDVKMEVLGGVGGTYGVDFIITGNTFSWAGLGFDGLLASGDKVQLEFFI